MTQSYSEPGGGGARRAANAVPGAQALLARLVPDADVALLMEALVAEIDAPAAGVRTAPDPTVPDGALSPGERELRRVRRQLALGAAARELQHAFNNPLAALLAESQLLQLDPLPEEQQRAVERIVALARRLVALTRQLDEGRVPGG